MEINNQCDVVFVSFGVFGGHEGLCLASLPSHRCINRKEFPLPPADLLAFSVYFLAGKKVCLPAVSAQPLEIVRIWRDAIPQGVRRNV